MLITLGLMLMANVSEVQAELTLESDTLVVEWQGDSGLIENALRDAVRGDTTATGERANPNRVYLLKRGGYYFNTSRLTNEGFHLNIVGEKGPADTPPATIKLLNLEDGGFDGKILSGQNDVTIKNVQLIGRSDLGNEEYEMLEFRGDNATITIDNVVFEYAQWGFMGLYGVDASIYITNSTFRNLISTTQKWGGRGLSVWSNHDLVFLENNTFFNIGGFAVQLEGGITKEFWFNHNTVVNNGRQVMLMGNVLNAYVANNLIVNPFWHGEDPSDFSLARLNESDNLESGMIELGPVAGLDGERVIAFGKNAIWRDSQFDDWYASVDIDATWGDTDIEQEIMDFFEDGLIAQPFMNQRTSNFMDNYDGMRVVDLIEGTDPELTTYPDLFDDMFTFMNEIRTNSEETNRYFWQPYYFPHDAWTSWTEVTEVDNRGFDQWPLPENFTYSNATLQSAGYGGYPLGDLNWFPAEKSSWMSDRASLEEEIRSIAAPEFQATFVSKIEAEDGSISGDENEIRIAEAEDQFYAAMQGAGSITWEADIESAGEYDIVLYASSDNVDREQNLYVNGENAGSFAAGFDDGWGDIIIPDISLTAGTNTIAIEPSWGWMNFGSLTIKDGDDTIVEFTADQAELDNIGLQCSGDLCASGNQFVEFISGGSLGFDISAETAGEYGLSVVFMRESAGDADLDVYVNDEFSSELTLSAASANSWAEQIVLQLDLDQGANTVELRHSNGSVSIDYVEVYVIQRIEQPTSAEVEHIAHEVKLNQNYPNPFNPTTTISFALPVDTDVNLTVYNLLGQRVAVLANGQFRSGQHSINFDASALASGMYIYRLEANNQTHTRKMLLIK